jgi:hypothetical protein
MSQKEFLKKIIEQTLAKDPSLKLPVKTKEPTKPINKIPAPSAPRIGEPQEHIQSRHRFLKPAGIFNSRIFRLCTRIKRQWKHQI